MVGNCIITETLIDSNTQTFNGSAEVRIGAHGDGGNLFDGYIPVVLIYNRVLSQLEIQSVYNYYAHPNFWFLLFNNRLN